MWFTVANFGTMLGPNQPSFLRWLLLLLLGGAVIGGLVWGAVLRRIRPQAYEMIGRGALDPLVDEPEIIPVG